LPEEDLDKYCLDVLGFLIVHNRKIRFNQLYTRLTKTMNYKISRPTLAEHLKHLVKRKKVLRRKEGKQNVSYKLNEKQFLNMKKTMEKQDEINKIASETEKILNELSLDDQIFFCGMSMLLRHLRQLRIEISSGLNSENVFQGKLEIMFLNNSANRYYERLLFNKSIKDREYGEKVLKRLDETIEDAMKELIKNPTEKVEKLNNPPNNQVFSN